MTHGAPRPGRSPRAVFLDRDGVLIEDTGYPSDSDVITLLPGVGRALRALRDAGWRLVIVSNQSAVARGKLTLATLAAVHERLLALLSAEGVAPDAVYFCPHHAEGSVPPFNVACDHRKPAPGMLLSAARRLRLDLGACWLIGDQERDVDAAHAAGCRAVRIGSGLTAAEATAADLPAAAAVILAVR
jgi:D-glycero-D-manno-heptose 1,7-bisphosphate phosphatase